MKKDGIIFLFTCVILAFGGQNQNATLSIDMNPSTKETDSSFITHMEGDAFSFSIHVDSITNVKGYTVEVNIDTNLFSFLSFELNDSVNSSIFDDSPMSFSNLTPQTVEIVVASIKPVSLRNACLAILTFQSKATYGDSAEISVNNAELIDALSNLDSVQCINSGYYRVIKPELTSINKFEPESRLKISTKYENHKLTLYGPFPLNTYTGSFEIEIFNFQGKRIWKSCNAIFSKPFGLNYFVNLNRGKYIYKLKFDGIILVDDIFIYN